MKAAMKRHRTRMPDVKVDWINRLPDDLLIHVLSFLTTKEAVQTCILSKRWRRVWVNLPILTFNVDEFGVDYSIGASDDSLRKSIARLNHFVSGVMENLESTHLDSVYYVHDTKQAYSYKVPIQWLDRVALLMPQLIDISISRVESVELPDSLFSCATLQYLKIKLLRSKKITVIPATIILPSLKVFDVADVDFHENFPQNLLIGCPSLETLNLSWCCLHFSSISSNMLKQLHIGGCRQYEPIQISCPNLSSLRICSFLQYGGAGITLKNMKFLETASIRLVNTVRCFSSVDVPVLNFLGALSSATRLILHIEGRELKVPLERDILNCRNLNNVKELFIGMSRMSFDFNLVASLLKLSPNVEKLTLMLDVSRVFLPEEHRQVVLGDALFQHEYIETVVIHDRHARKLPEFFLKTLMRTLNAYVKEIGNVIIE